MPRVGVDPRNDGPNIAFESGGHSTVQDNAASWFDETKRFNTVAMGSLARCCQFIQDGFKRTKCASALKMQTIVLRNASGSVACAWIVTACYSLGDVFSGKPSRDQSRRELMISNSAWASIAFSCVVLIAQVPLLMSFRFLDAPDRRPTLFFCLKKLVRIGAFYFFVMFTVMVGWSTLVGYLTWIKPTLFKYKLDGHINTLTTHGFFAGVTLATKKIYYQETCQGRDKLIARQKTQMLSGKKRPRTGPQNQLPSASAKSTPQKQTFSYWRTYIKEFPKSVPAAVTGSFVQVLSQQRIMDRSGSTIACFVIASILLKLATQAIIKHYIIKKRIRSIRIMCAAVALPTVLIDTQTRIILLGTQSARFFTLGTLALALVEILLRSGRAYHLMRTIHNRELNIPSRRESTSTTLQQGSTKRLGSNSPSPACLEFELWRCRFQAYHVAEISADTYAEYIAMGCSASILVFFGDHPHYSLLRKLDTSGDPDSKRSIQLKMLAFQIAVEVVVDFVTTALEMTVGIEFGPSKSVGSFLTVFLAAIAVLNIIISIGIYLF